MTRASLLALSVALVACQPTEPPVPPDDFLGPWVESVNFVARSLDPDVMLLVDDSAAMGAPVDPSRAECPSGCGVRGAACPAGCETWSSALATGLGQVLATHPTTARLGLTTFPGSEGCEATSPNTLIPMSTSDDIDSELIAEVGAIQQRLLGLTPAGPSPTANALRLINRSIPSSADRSQFVLLVTGSAPNQGCHPADTAEATLELAKRHLKTVVVALGAVATSREGRLAFNAIASNGGFERECFGSDLACGANEACDPNTKLCERQYYSASSAAELEQLLRGFFNPLPPGNPCHYMLARRAKDPAHLQVTLDSVIIPSDDPTGGWDYAAGQVTFKGALCQRISRATAATPVRAQFTVFWAR